MRMVKRGFALWKMLGVSVALTFVVGLVGRDLCRVKRSDASVQGLPPPGEMLEVSKVYAMPVLRGLHLDPDNPLHIDFIIDSGNEKDVSQKEVSVLIRYFLAALTVPQSALWVNLSPYESDRVIDESLGITDLGRDMLAQDYVLKQLASSLTHPDTETGRAYWTNRRGDPVGRPERESKIWIVPDKAEVYETGTTAVITEATLKLQCEDQAQQVLLPAITKDVNEGKNFARLRQIYHAILLGLWFKHKFAESFYAAYLDKSRVNGIDLEDKKVKDKIYATYVKAFEKGVYDVLRTSVDSGQIQLQEQRQRQGKKEMRRYFSGGAKFIDMLPETYTKKAGNRLLGEKLVARTTFAGSALMAGIDIKPAYRSIKDERFDLEHRFAPEVVNLTLQDFISVPAGKSSSSGVAPEKVSEIPMGSREVVRGGKKMYVAPDAETGMAEMDNLVAKMENFVELLAYGIVKDYDDDTKVLVDFVSPRADKILMLDHSISIHLFSIGVPPHIDALVEDVLSACSQVNEMTLMLYNGKLVLFSDESSDDENVSVQVETLIDDMSQEDWKKEAWSVFVDFLAKTSPIALPTTLEGVKKYLLAQGGVSLNMDWDCLAACNRAYVTKIYMNIARERAERVGGVLGFTLHYHPSIGAHFTESMDVTLKPSTSDLCLMRDEQIDWFEIRSVVPSGVNWPEPVARNVFSMAQVKSSAERFNALMEEMEGVDDSNVTPDDWIQYIRRIIGEIDTLTAVGYNGVCFARAVCPPELYEKYGVYANTTKINSMKALVMSSVFDFHRAAEVVFKHVSIHAIRAHMLLGDLSFRDKVFGGFNGTPNELREQMNDFALKYGLCRLPVPSTSLDDVHDIWTWYWYMRLFVVENAERFPKSLVTEASQEIDADELSRKIFSSSAVRLLPIATLKRAKTIGEHDRVDGGIDLKHTAFDVTSDGSSSALKIPAGFDMKTFSHFTFTISSLKEVKDREEELLAFASQ